MESQSRETKEEDQTATAVHAITHAIWHRNLAVIQKDFFTCIEGGRKME